MARLASLQEQIDDLKQSTQLLSSMHETLVEGTSKMTNHLRERTEIVEVLSKSSELRVKEEQTRQNQMFDDSFTKHMVF